MKNNKKCLYWNLFSDFQLKKTMSIVLLMFFMCTNIMEVSAQRAPLTFTKGRIALSHDGNSYDLDDIFAVAIQWGIFSAYGVQDKVVHWDICDNMEKTNPTTYKEQLISGEGWKFFSGWRDPSTFLFDCTKQLPAALANFKREAEKSTSEDPLFFICSGPMEVPWRMINNIDPAFRKYITCISHSKWNEEFSAVNSTHTWAIMKADFAKDGVTFVDLSDQNQFLGANKHNFSWLSSMPAGTCIPPSSWEWIRSRNIKGDWDCSDAGMVLNLLTGVSFGTGPAIKELFLNPICKVDTKYTISATAGANGTISPSGSVTVNSGASQSFAITPNSGFQIDVLTIDGVSKPISNPYNFANVTANHSIAVSFKLASVKYTISAISSTNGTISPSGSVTVNSGASQSFAITPNSGYQIDVLTVDGVSQPITNPYNFTNILVNHTISATFKVSDQPVSAITGWVSGTTNNKVAGSNRLMVVMVMGESASNFGANGVTYGGQSMTKQIDKMYFVSGNRTYASIFTLNEAGVNAAASGAIAVTWSVTPSVGNSIYSVLLSNVDQITPAITPVNNGLTGTSIEIATTLTAATGDMAIMCGATENNVIQTFNNGFIKEFESNSTWGDGVGGYKLGTSVNETPKFTQSASGRMALCALIVKKASLNSTPLATNTIESDDIKENGTRIYPNPVSNILNVDFAGPETSREIKVFSITGQLLRCVQTQNASVQIDVKSLKINGVVLIQVVEGNTVSNHRVIIN